MTLTIITSYVCDKCDHMFDIKPKLDLCDTCGEDFCEDCEDLYQCNLCNKLVCEDCSDEDGNCKSCK